jgi:dUTPase
MAKRKGEVAPAGPPKAPTDRVPVPVRTGPRGGIPLRVNLESHVCPGVSVQTGGGVKYITLIPSATIKLDCGLDLEAPDSHDLVLRPVDELVQQGVFLGNGGSAVDGRVHVYLTNAGKNTVAITHGQMVARLALVPFEAFSIGGEE